MLALILNNLSRARPTYPRILIGRYSSSDVTRTSKDDQESPLVKEEESVLSKTINREVIPEAPIKCFDLVKNIDKVKKTGSFAVDLFTGSYDHDFLIFPDIVDNRDQCRELKRQADMVEQLYPQIWDDEYQLQKFNFYNIHQLSVTEMMTIFESIGAGARRCYDNENALAMDQAFTIPAQTKVSKSIISLIIRNCLVSWPIAQSKNEYVKRLLPQKHILFSKYNDDAKLYPPIGFAWTEQAVGLGSLPPQEWLTIGQRGDKDVSAHLIQGRKTKVLYEEPMEHFLIYFRDKLLSERYKVDVGDQEPNPSSDPFISCALVEKSQVKMGDVYFDSAGCEYVDIEIDDIIADSQIVFHAQRKDPRGVNIKALGQLATCSVILGILKDSLRMTYQHLIKAKSGLLDCDIIQRKLCEVTSRIFAIESMVYYIAGMYDGLEDGFDAHMETTILKVVANEFAYECLRDIQHIFGSDMFIISKLQDQINLFDSFLDGNIYNRLYISTMGIIWFARSKNMHLNKLRLAPWYPGYFVKNLLRERAERGDYLTLDADICGHLHPSLRDASVNLEYIVKRIKHASESLCMRHGRDVTGAQSALYKMAQLAIDSFMVTAVCSRASKSYCNGSKHAEIDVDLATSFARSQAREVRLYMDELDVLPITSLETRSKLIHQMNLKSGGYYAESPLDPNM